MSYYYSYRVCLLLAVSHLANSSVFLEATNIVGNADVGMVQIPSSHVPYMSTASSVTNQHCDQEKQYCKPGFLIIGAGKSGTSSLYYYLQDHPQVQPAKMKQIQFFDHQFHRGSEWYFRAHFPHSMEQYHITGESSPGYIVYSDVPGKVCLYFY
jgi:hypothetical protein